MAFMGLEPTTDCLIPLLERIEAQAKGDLAGLDQSGMDWRPPAGGWSVAQVLEHMVITNELYMPRVAALITHAATSQGEARAWKPSLMGRILIKAVLPTTPRKVKTLAKLEPDPVPGPDVVTRFLGTVREITDLLWRSKGIDMRKPRMTSPVSPLFRRLNLGDAFVILVAHTQRHMQQIERTIALPGFPASGAAAG